jgi:ADP-ribose pyrophosphatase YjhB (NUDIX family)
MWHIPGDTVLKGETLEETAKRVAKEELGVQIEVGKMLGVVEFLQGSFKNYSFQDVVLEFSARILSGEVKAVRDAEEARFFKILPKDMIEKQKEFLSGIL